MLRLSALLMPKVFQCLPSAGATLLRRVGVGIEAANYWAEPPLADHQVVDKHGRERGQAWAKDEDGWIGVGG